MMNRFHATAVAVLSATAILAAWPARAADVVYFSATDNITNALVQRINAETVRIDMSAWYLTERAISQALVNRMNAGVKVRLLGDRGSIFEIDPNTREEFYWVASQGVPIRLRYHPTWFPEIHHWKATIFAGQNVVAFGSANYTTFELAPWSSTNYQDEVVLISDDQALVNAFKTKFDRYWNDTNNEPESIGGSAPYFVNWDVACAMESACADYPVKYPNPKPMAIDPSRLEPEYPSPPSMVWGQGPSFNDRLVQEINQEQTAIDFVIYRLTVGQITDALIAKSTAGVPVRVIVEPEEYVNEKWPEFWITHANLDKLWAAGVPMRQRIHQGLTHMKLLLTSSIATIASSNFTAGWQRDHNYFLPAATKPAAHQAVKTRFQAMWTDNAGFAAFVPKPPHEPFQAHPGSNATGVATNTSLTWHRAAFATDYDVIFGTSSGSMTKVANVKAELSNNPPEQYSWTPPSPLLAGTTYYWQIVARTNATPVDPSVVTRSTILSFTTAGTSSGPVSPGSPSPANGATGVGSTPTLTWSGSAAGTTFNVAFGTTNPPPQVATGLATASYQPGTLNAGQTYFWRVTALSSAGTVPGPVWSFATGTGGGGGPTSNEVVIYAADATTVGAAWGKVNDGSAAGGVKLRNPDQGADVVASPLANPGSYVEASFNAQAGTRYRVWFRIHPIGEEKWNDSFFVQFSDSVNAGGNPVYRIGSPGGYIVNLWTCATCQTSGWGWQRGAYWLADEGDVWFPTTGTHTIRVQTREDGVEIDQIVISPATFANSAPGGTSNDTTIVPKPTTGGGPGPGPSAPEIVIYANSVPTANLKGAWSTTSDGASPGGVKLVTTNTGYAQPDAPLAAPVHFFDLTFNATANTPYHIWLRLHAPNGDKFNDAVWVQFSDARANGSPIYPIGSNSGLLVNLATDSGAASLDGWGWQDGAYWLSQPTTVTFPTTGARTLRVQVREDGVQLDQIVLSPSRFLNAPPGPPTRDNTIVVP